MYARIVRTDGDYDRETIAAALADAVVPSYARIPGYCGISANHQPGAGAVWAVSTWRDLDAVRASEELSEHLRRRWATGTRRRLRGARVYELPVQVAGSRLPVAGSALHVVPFRLEGPVAAEDGIGCLRDDLVAGLASWSGFRAARVLFDRRTGSGLLTTAWDAADTGVQAYESAMVERLCAAARGVELGRATTREIIFAHVLTRTP